MAATTAASTLHVLARDGDAKVLQQALKSSNPNVTDGDGMTPLHFAAWYGHPEACVALINANADINAFDHDGSSAMHAAAFNGQLPCIMTLVENGGDALLTDNEGCTPKASAAKEKQTDVVNFLRIIEEEQKRQRNMETLKAAYEEALQECKQYKPEVTRAIKEAKKLISSTEKAEKKLKKETIKLKKERKKGKVGSPSLAQKGPTTFSQMTMPIGSNSAVGKTALLAARKSNVSEVSSENITERPLPSPPKVNSDVAGEMVVAQFEADAEDDKKALGAFLKSLDIEEFARLFKDITLAELQEYSAAKLQELGLPAGVRKKIWNKLHP
eukprot:m.45385 g.45385  ORF g.45385 m.45385 type:complete len:328 (+) comp10241_c0_seq1:127-1110(+)